MRKSVLVIVDMQTSFNDGAKKVLQENLDAIHIAKQKNMFVVVLEYRGSGATLKPIKKSLEEYSLVVYKQKGMCDGSSHVQKVLKEHDISPTRFFVTGVYSNACVYETVTGLAKKYLSTPVVVIDRAVADMYEQGFRSKNCRIKNMRVQKGKISKRLFTLSIT